MYPKKNYSFITLFLLLFLSTVTVKSQVEVDVNLNIRHSVDGVSDFGRERHIITHTGPTDPDWRGHEDMMDYFFNDLDVYFGRDNGSAGWKCKMTEEDPNRPHWPDTNSIETVGTGLKNWYESSAHIDRHQFESRMGSMIMGTNPYPVYPSLDWSAVPTDGSYNGTGKMDSGWQTYDVDAAAFFNAQYLDKHYAKTPDEIGEPLPTYWECINEPDMAILKPFVFFLSSPEKLFEYHNLSAQEIRNTLGEHAPKIGGFTWGQHDFWASDWINRVNAVTSYYDFSDPAIFPVYDNMWLGDDGNGTRSEGSTIWQKKGEYWWQWDGLFQGFIDACGANMDFYSVHIYDWPTADNGGSIRTGGHTEAMLDMIEWYDLHKFGTRKDIIISEYGSVNGSYLHTLGYKRRDWENLRPFNQMFMQFLERPSHLVLTMPFAPIKATWGDWWNADGSILQRYEVTMMDPIGEYRAPGNTHEDWEWSDIILWYELWSDVKGTRIDTKSSDRDIQVDAYVDGNHVYLILNNLEIDPQDINLNLFDDYENDIVSVKIKHQHFNEGLNRAVNEVKEMASAPGQVTLDMSATMILDFQFANPVTIDQESNEYKYMSLPLTSDMNMFGSQLCHITSNAGTEFTANVNGVDVPSIGEATIRIGVRVWNGVNFNVVLNDQTVLVGQHGGPIQDIRGRQESRGGYGYWGMLEIDVPVTDLATNNEIKISCPHSNIDISSVQIQTWDFTKAPGRSSDGTGYVAVSDIALVGDNSVMQGEELPLNVDFTPTNATRKGITWSSSNPAVATVDEFGVVTGVAASGTTTITATSADNGAAVATKTITATAFDPVLITGIEIQEGTSIDVEYYINTPLTAVISPVDASVQTIEWSSSDEDVVHVNPETGKITGKTINETATITATVVDTYSGDAVYTDEIEVFVTVAGGERVISRLLPDVIRPYPESDLDVFVQAMGARRVELEISKNGTAIAEGELEIEEYGYTTVTVPYNLLNASPQIDTDYDVVFRLFDGTTQLDIDSGVVRMVDHYRAESVEIVEGIRLVQIGETIQLESLVLPENTYNQDVAWTSSDPGIATVDATTGVVTGVGDGDAVITVTSDDGGFTDQVTVTSQVDEVHIYIDSIILADSIHIFPRMSEDISYIFYPRWATDTNISWESSSTDIVLVDENGRITAGSTLESVMITATATDTVGVAATTKVIVSPTITVEAEDFVETGGEYDGFNRSDIGIDWNQSGDWGDYEVEFPTDGDFSVRYFIGTPDGNTDIAVNIYLDGVLQSTTTLTPTGGWDNFQAFDAAADISVTAGVHTIRIESAGTSEWQWNMDKFQLTAQEIPCDPLVSITSPATASIGLNGQGTIDFSTEPACQKQYSLFSWSSSDTDIATVDQFGVVTGVANGDADITIALGGISSTTTVTVSVVLPTDITVEPSTVNLVTGRTRQLTVDVQPEYASDKSVTWSSDNANITVDANGVISGDVVGEEATITATSVADPTVSGTAIVTIVETPDSYVIEAEDFVETGGTLDDSQWGGPGEGVRDAGEYIEWVNNEDWVEYTLDVTTGGDFSIDYFISTPESGSQIQFILDGITISTDNVSNNGAWDDFQKLTAANSVTLSSGSHTIKILASNANTWQWNLDKIELTEVEECVVSGISVAPSTIDLNVGETATITPTVTSSGSCNGVMWSSSDTSVAKVDNGVVTAVASGTATITATTLKGGYSADVSVEVSSVSVTGVILSDTSITIGMNGSANLTATIAPENASEQRVTWSSSDTTVAKVSAEGVVSGAGESGVATITVTTVDGGYTATCIVNVSGIDITDIILNIDRATINVDEQLELIATVEPENATNTEITWSSSDTDIATVDAQGVVRGVGFGRVTITASGAGGNVIAEARITVLNPDTGGGTNLQEDISSVQLEIYPNPAKDLLTINGLEAGDYTIKVLNLQGAEMLYKELNIVSGYTMSVNSLPDGVYILNISNSEVSKNLRFIKNE